MCLIAPYGGMSVGRSEVCFLDVSSSTLDRARFFGRFYLAFLHNFSCVQLAELCLYGFLKKSSLIVSCTCVDKGAR